MKNLLLVTQGFPFGASEQGFLPVEYEALSRHFHLSVLAFGGADTMAYPVSENVRCDRYTWPDNLSPIGLLRQIQYPEVREDLARAFRANPKKFLKRAARILAYSLRAEQSLPTLRCIIQQRQTDILYTYWGVQATVAAIRLKKEFPALRVISRLHGADLYMEQAQDGWQILRPYLAQGCSRLLFVSQDGLSYFMRHFGSQRQEKAMVAYIGCRAFPRCASIHTPDRPLVLVSCSSLIPLKRVSLIVEALAQLPREIPVNWHHLGDGELQPALEAKARDLLANNSHIRYTFHGHIPNQALAKSYQDIGAQLFITTSETEGLPVSMMEAYAMGIPILATAVGGIPEMVTDGENGFLLPQSPSPAEVAAGIARFAALPEAAKRAMSQNAWECWQACFDAKENAENLMEVLSMS